MPIRFGIAVLLPFLLLFVIAKMQLSPNSSVPVAAVASAQKGALFFVSGDSYGVKCPADKDVNWDTAVIALSKYVYDTPDPSPAVVNGGAEIERNFEDNCVEDMKIYNAFVATHPGS